MKFETVESDKPKRVVTPVITKKILTTSEVLDEIVRSLDIHDLLNGDELRLRTILTSPRNLTHRNETYQRSVLRILVDYLIKKGWLVIR